MIAIIDYHCGNLGSIHNMLNKIGIENIITNDSNIIREATKIILPGVGSFDTGISNLKKLNLIDVLNEEILVKKKPVLGICLGMQLMCTASEEGTENGLSWIPQVIRDFRKNDEFIGTIPVMGWNYVETTKKNDILNDDESRFYFVHRFYCEKNEFEIIQSNVNNFIYCAAFNRDNIYGVQFHPEKSHKFGVKILSNFCNL
jgi:glutamine amidotransferase